MALFSHEAFSLPHAIRVSPAKRSARKRTVGGKKFALAGDENSKSI
jgi:hypothetical protein